MKTIRAYTKYDEFNNAHYYNNFKVVNYIPKVNEDYNGEKVISVKSVMLDTEQGNEEVFNYDYFCIETIYDEEEGYTEHYYIAIEK